MIAVVLRSYKVRRAIKTALMMQTVRSNATAGLDCTLSTASSGPSHHSIVVYFTSNCGACTLIIFVTQVSGTWDRLTASSCHPLLLAEIACALVLLDHHINGLLCIVKIELVILCLLLLRIFLLLVVIMIQRMFWSLIVNITPAYIIDRAGTASNCSALLHPVIGTGTHTFRAGWWPTQDLLLQLHVLTVLFGTKVCRTLRM